MKSKPTPSRDDILIAELVRANTDALRALSRSVSELAAIVATNRAAPRTFDPTTKKTPVSPELLAQLRPPEIPVDLAGRHNNDMGVEDTMVARPSRMPSKPSNNKPA